MDTSGQDTPRACTSPILKVTRAIPAPSPDSAIHSAIYSPSQSPVQSRHGPLSGSNFPILYYYILYEILIFLWDSHICMIFPNSYFVSFFCMFINPFFRIFISIPVFLAQNLPFTFPQQLWCVSIQPFSEHVSGPGLKILKSCFSSWLPFTCLPLVSSSTLR